MKPVRLGVIGCGVIANRSHLPDATSSDLFDLVAVADIRVDRAKEATEKFNVPKWYAEAVDLIADENVEAVSLALPAGVRTAEAYRALRAGKHILLEKPVASNRFEVDTMQELQGDLVAACCSSRFTFTPMADAARECVAAGTLGDLRIIRCNAVLPAKAAPENEPPPWRESYSLNGGGILVNWGCYDLNYLLHIVDWQAQPQTVLSQVWPVAPELDSRAATTSDAEAHCITLIRCTNGAVISFERGEFATSTKHEQWAIVGSKATLRLQMLPGEEQELLLDRADPQTGVSTECIWQGENPGNINLHMMEDFARAIRNGARPRTDLERAATIQRITDAVYQSARSGNAITIGEL